MLAAKQSPATDGFPSHPLSFTLFQVLRPIKILDVNPLMPGEVLRADDQDQHQRINAIFQARGVVSLDMGPLIQAVPGLDNLIEAAGPHLRDLVVVSTDDIDGDIAVFQAIMQTDDGDHLLFTDGAQRRQLGEVLVRGLHTAYSGREGGHRLGPL